jgi:hypothetical protein
MKLPEFFEASNLIPVKYYRYSSRISLSFYELDTNSEESRTQYAADIRRFHDLKRKCLSMELEVPDKTGNLVPLTDIWDNRVVIECDVANKPPMGGKIWIGYNDGVYSVGLGCISDRWIKPYSYRKVVKETI